MCRPCMQKSLQNSGTYQRLLSLLGEIHGQRQTVATPLAHRYTQSTALAANHMFAPLRGLSEYCIPASYVHSPHYIISIIVMRLISGCQACQLVITREKEELEDAPVHASWAQLTAVFSSSHFILKVVF